MSTSKEQIEKRLKEIILDGVYRDYIYYKKEIKIFTGLYYLSLVILFTVLQTIISMAFSISGFTANPILFFYHYSNYSSWFSISCVFVGGVTFNLATLNIIHRASEIIRLALEAFEMTPEELEKFKEGKQE